MKTYVIVPRPFGEWQIFIFGDQEPLEDFCALMVRDGRPFHIAEEVTTCLGYDKKGVSKLDHKKRKTGTKARSNRKTSGAMPTRKADKHGPKTRQQFGNVPSN